MKKIVRLVSLVLCVLLLMGTVPVLADYQDYTEMPDIDITGLDAEGIVNAFLAAFDDIALPDKMSVAYRNMVTGEEYFLNGDMEIVAASLYKVPLNMYWAEKVYNGEITMEEDVIGTTLRYAQEESLINSSNSMAAALHDKIGKYGKFRTAIGPYLGLTVEEATDVHYTSSENLTARQMLYCMDLLYNDPDRYPGVLECLKQAQPGEYFRSIEDRYTIAQKYGYLDTAKFGSIVNCAGIIYAEQPFLLVVMTSCQRGLGLRMGILAKLLCDYAAETAAATTPTPEPTAEPTATPKVTATPKATAEPSASAAAVTTVTASPVPAESNAAPASGDIIFYACGAVALFCVIRLAVIFMSRKKRHRH